jgi:hypothetical protein
MIDPKELRLGNYIKEGNETILVDEDFIEVLMGARNYYSFEPIPLTPEIMEAAGFGVDISRIEYEPKISYNVTCAGYMLAFNLRDIEVFVKPYKSNILYLHQLQNLYFALTGKELEIKMPILKLQS